MKAYISVSFHKRSSLRSATERIAKTLREFNIEPFIFADAYRFDLKQEKEMMRKALEEIDSSALFIAETSDKAIGVGVEAGYAKAMNKPVLYLRNQMAEHSSTLSGISDYHILYSDIDDLQQQLRKTMPGLLEAFTLGFS